MRFAYRHFPFLGQESDWAAEASECAGQQDQFWPFHDKLFAEWRGEGTGAFAIPNLKRFAEELGLDTVAFNACIDSGGGADQVAGDRQSGADRGVRTTPTVFINGVQVTGNQPFEVFQTIIEEELGKAE